MNNKFNKILKPLVLFSSFALSVIAVIFVHAQQYGTFNILSDTQSRILNNIPIVNNLNSKKYVLSEVPTSADVEVTGNAYEMDKINSQTLFRLYISNKKLVEGNNTLEIKTINNSNSLKINVLNRFINVRADAIKSKNIKIFPQYINQQELGDKVITKAILSEKEITIRSSQSKLNNVSYGNVVIDVSHMSTGENKVLPAIVLYNSKGKVVNDVEVKDKISAKLEIKESK